MMRQRVQKNMIYVTHDQIEAMTLADRIVVMHEGHIQQQGTPEELFKRPANKFVAGFLGSPPMNFLDAELVHRDGGLFAVGAAFALALPAHRAQTLTRASRRVLLGLRPSDLDYAPEAPPDNALELKVLVSEYIGAQSVLLCACGATQISVELKSETPIALGDTLRFAVRSEGLHIFDRTTERAL